MSEKTPISELTHPLEALSKERLRAIYEVMLHKSLEHRAISNEAAGATSKGFQESLEEWEGEDYPPISDFVVSHSVLKKKQPDYARPQLIVSRYEGDPEAATGLGSNAFYELESQKDITIQLHVERRVQKGLLPDVSINVVLYEPDLSRGGGMVSKTRLNIHIEQEGTLSNESEEILVRNMDANRIVVFNSDGEVANDDQDIDTQEVNKTVDQCLALVEKVLK